MTTAEQAITAPGAPEWSSDEAILAALDALQPPHLQKKIATIFALVDARLAGRSEETVWARPDTVNRKIYHVKWKKDPVFAAALDAVHKAALRAQNQRALDAVRLAAYRLQLASPAAAGVTIKSMTNDDPNVALRAALAILDRAGLETAPKNETHAVGPTPLDQWRRDAERRRAEVDDMLGEMDDADEAGALAQADAEADA